MELILHMTGSQLVELPNPGVNWTTSWKINILS